MVEEEQEKAQGRPGPGPFRQGKGKLAYPFEEVFPQMEELHPKQNGVEGAEARPWLPPAPGVLPQAQGGADGAVKGGLGVGLGEARFP